MFMSILCVHLCLTLSFLVLEALSRGYRPLEDVAPAPAAPGAAQRLRSSVGVLMDDALLSVSQGLGLRAT